LRRIDIDLVKVDRRHARKFLLNEVIYLIYLFDFAQLIRFYFIEMIVFRYLEVKAIGGQKII
jgi:hypothetical protein